jgi:Ser/Thr protein kinase RdoA (MazF antagonist)
LPGEVYPIGDPGLINGTWCVGRPVTGILQWVNPIFAAEIQRDIQQLTERLIDRGLVSPTVLSTRDGRLWVPHAEVGEGDGNWRVLSFVPGTTLHRIEHPDQAFEGASLVGRFHAALDGWRVPRHAPVRRIHDTPARMSELRSALRAHQSHPLFREVEAVASAILEGWERAPVVTGLPERTCHGDLKISNLRFDAQRRRAICLLDLDTIGPMELACELGDMWRSWCNPAGEDDPSAVRFDLAIFRASVEGFLSTAPNLSTSERAALVSAPVRICLELAARFGADALRNSYFREDRERFPVAGRHNLHRARAQLQLARAAAAVRSDCERILGVSTVPG